MAYVPSSEFQGEIDQLINDICKSLVFQEKYCIESPWVDGIRPNDRQKRRPNYEALNHAHPLISLEYAVHMGHLLQFNQKFIGAIVYWQKLEEHYISNQWHIDTGACVIHANAIISLKEFLQQISDQTVEQVRRLEKVLFCFET